jgi:hypothetical protein
MMKDRGEFRFCFVLSLAVAEEGRSIVKQRFGSVEGESRDTRRGPATQGGVRPESSIIRKSVSPLSQSLLLLRFPLSVLVRRR